MTEREVQQKEAEEEQEAATAEEEQEAEPVETARITLETEAQEEPQG